MQAALADALLARLQPEEPDSVRSAALGSAAELVEVLVELAAPWAVRLAAAAARETSCGASENRHHAAFALGLIVRLCLLHFAVTVRSR